MRKNIIFCGGGSGGHVLPALTLIRRLKELYPDCEVTCIGSYDGIESRLLTKYNYTSISTGKLRRYFSLQNILDIFKVFLGIIQAYLKMFSLKSSETIIISTGGFVTIPVILAGRLQGKPVVLHEQTTRAGLANRIASIFAQKCLLTFEESLEFFPRESSIWTGYPLRKEILLKDKELHLIEGLTGYEDLPILFLTGGGNGSKLLNETLNEILPKLKKDYFIVHQCGKAFLNKYKNLENETYRVYDFIDSAMVPLLKNAKVIISRAGAGTVCELMALGKPSILIPLKIAQKNEQYHNAIVAKNRIGSIVIEEDNLTPDSLIESIDKILNIKPVEISRVNPVDRILEEISKI